MTTKTRDLSDLLDANGDVKATHLDNASGTTINNNANNRIITGSSSANTLEGETNLTFDGTNLDLPDDKKIRLGTGNDLEIYHNGSHSIIEDVGTGKLEIRSNGTGVDIQKENAEFMARFITDGAVELYHDHSKKLETTSGGLAVTGGIAIGGTGAANTLDDYEYGTWTPSLSNFSTSGTVTTVGRYVKAGRMVTATGTMKAATSIAHDASALVSGFPFAGPLTDFGTGTFALHGLNGGGDEGVLVCDLVSSRVFFPSSMNTTTSNELVSFTVTYESAS